MGFNFKLKADWPNTTLTALEAGYQNQDGFGFDQVELVHGGTDVVLPAEWRENVRMSKASFSKLCEELRPYIERQSTNMRSPVEVERQVAVTLYYLSDEGRLRKTANAFGLSRSCVSITV